MMKTLRAPKPFSSASAPAPVVQRSRCSQRCSASKNIPVQIAKHASLVATSMLSLSSAAHAEELAAAVAVEDPGNMLFAVGAGVAVVGLGALLVATDPQKR